MIEAWRADYNTVRSHGRLGMLAPSEYAAQHTLETTQTGQTERTTLLGAGVARWVAQDRSLTSTCG